MKCNRYSVRWTSSTVVVQTDFQVYLPCTSFSKIYRAVSLGDGARAQQCCSLKAPGKSYPLVSFLFSAMGATAGIAKTTRQQNLSHSTNFFC